jgi:sugar-specific transcriptional regulator TrmB
MLQELINNFYLNEKEAKAYLATLELGRSRVSRIANKAGLNRITAYEVLKRLIEMGIAQSTVYSGVQTFAVVPPEILVEKQESRLAVAKKVLPELALLSASKANKPAISYYEGAEGIRSIYEDTLVCKEKNILNIAHPQNLLKAIGEDFFAQYVKKRTRRKIHVDVLLPDVPENKKYKKEATSAMRQIKFFNVEKYPLPNEIFIYDDKVALLSFSSLVGVIVEDKDIAQSVKSLWQLVWDGVK